MELEIFVSRLYVDWQDQATNTGMKSHCTCTQLWCMYSINEKPRFEQSFCPLHFFLSCWLRKQKHGSWPSGHSPILHKQWKPLNLPEIFDFWSTLTFFSLAALRHTSFQLWCPGPGSSPIWILKVLFMPNVHHSYNTTCWHWYFWETLYLRNTLRFLRNTETMRNLHWHLCYVTRHNAVTLQSCSTISLAGEFLHLNIMLTI